MSGIGAETGRLAMDDIVTRLRFVAQIHEGRVKHECIAGAADEIERLRRENAWYKAVNIQMNQDLTELSKR